MFANVLLVDEINRASPKTQSSLLEAMQETQVTVDGATHALERPFLVIATQNPVEYEGTYPLPEAQLDRFAVRMTIGYPPLGDEARMLAEQTTEPPLDTLRPVAGRAELVDAIAAARHVHVDESVTRYVVALLRHTRASGRLALGGSPRSGIALLALAKARALVERRDYVLPDDVQALAVDRARASADPRPRGAGHGRRPRRRSSPRRSRAPRCRCEAPRRRPPRGRRRRRGLGSSARPHSRSSGSGSASQSLLARASGPGSSRAG